MAGPGIPGARGGFDVTQAQDEFKKKYGENTLAYMQQGGIGSPREYGQFSGTRDYLSSLPGGKWSSDPYERAQQIRNSHQADYYKKYYGDLDPTRALQDRLGNEAYDFRKRDLPGLLQEKRDEITRSAGTALDQGLHKTRSNMSNRGLLYSGLEQGAEGSVRGNVANTMAKQIYDSNADLNKLADAKDQTAASAGLNSYQASLQAQSRVEDLNMQNDLRRIQQMQQLGHGVGEVAGSAYGYNSNRGNAGGGQPAGLISDDQYYNAYASVPYSQYMSGGR